MLKYYLILRILNPCKQTSLEPVGANTSKTHIVPSLTAVSCSSCYFSAMAQFRDVKPYAGELTFEREDLLTPRDFELSRRWRLRGIYHKCSVWLLKSVDILG